jgi:uncharacterized protein (TIGR03435 family)
MIVRWMCAAVLMGSVVPGALGQLSGKDAKAAADVLPGATYDVATIKASDPDAQGGGVGTRPNGTFYTKNQPLKYTVCSAYDVKFFLCFGGPAWLESDPYDLEAKPDSATAEQLLKLPPKQRWPVQQRMQQALFEDRLKLKVHFETRQVPTFALVVAKGGLKMQEAKASGTYANGLKGPDGKAFGGGSFMVGEGKMTAQAISMDSLAGQLGATTDHVVENKTGLTGVYDFTLQYADSDQPSSDSTTPSIYTALQEQLGLKLESTKGPVQVLVIDHAERPAEN